MRVAPSEAIQRMEQAIAAEVQRGEMTTAARDRLTAQLVVITSASIDALLDAKAATLAADQPTTTEAGPADG